MIGDVIDDDGLLVNLALVVVQVRRIVRPVGIEILPDVLQHQPPLRLRGDGQRDAHLLGIGLCRTGIG